MKFEELMKTLDNIEYWADTMDFDELDEKVDEVVCDSRWAYAQNEITREELNEFDNRLGKKIVYESLDRLNDKFYEYYGIEVA